MQQFEILNAISTLFYYIVGFQCYIISFTQTVMSSNFNVLFLPSIFPYQIQQFKVKISWVFFFFN